MTEVIKEAVLDALPVLPFLFVVYILIEVIERKLMFANRAKVLLGGKFAPLIGAGMGLIPQCGFSVMATNLYNSGNLTIGTLMAVFIATSDEAIPIMLSNGTSALRLLPMLGIKLLFALFMGYLLDLIFKKSNAARMATPKSEEETVDEEIGCCHHKLEKEKKVDKKDFVKTYLMHPLFHSVKIFLYIVIINFAFGTLIYLVGEDKIAGFLSASGIFQPFIAGIIGLIPNCAASVLISQLYVLGGISFGACVTGLSVNAGIALALLFKKNNLKNSLLILAILYFSSVILGLILSPIPW